MIIYPNRVVVIFRYAITPPLIPMWSCWFNLPQCFHYVHQVHNAVSRTVEALENWLQLKLFQLPRSHILNASLHFEALTDHSYSFHCVLCGNYPPLLNLDVDKKGVFELSG